MQSDSTRTVELGERTIRIRPLRPEDAPFLVDVFEHMGQESRYRRFNQSVDHVDIDRVWAEAEQIAQSVTLNSRGVIAFCDSAERPEVPIGAARYVKLSPDQAEAAVSVRDDMQGVGVGTELMRQLVETARGNGLKTLVSYIQNDNKAIWRLLRRLGYAVTREPEGSATFITLYLDQPDGWVDPLEEANVVGQQK